jgi:hypothetical protein
MPLRVRDISFSKAFADAGALWRAEREVLAPIAGVFFFLPLLGIVMLFSAGGVPASGNDPQALWTALNAFAKRLVVPILLFNVTTSFGSFAVLTVLLQGGGRKLGEVLRVAVRRFPPFLGMDLVIGIIVNIGFFSLLVAPGLFVFCRTWLAAPAYAAAPEKGLAAALQQGWALSGRWNWLIVLLVGAAVFLATLGLAVIATILLGALATVGGQVATVASLLTATLLSTAAWIAFTLLRVALYRASVPSDGT